MSAADRGPEYAELHFHLGQSLRPHILWSMAFEHGIKLPTKDYWEFYELVTLEHKKDVTWDDYHKLFHWTELIQSSPLAMERTVYEVISGAYRRSNITLAEPSFNPMFRNRGGERDLDQIILAALRGMERALVEFPVVRAGLVLLLDRRLSLEKNAVIAKKAAKYRSRGVVGIGMAGPAAEGFRYADYAGLYAEARAKGLKTTVHTGEEGSVEEMEHVLDVLPVDRVDHGFRAYESPKVMDTLAQKGLTLTLCPTSNLTLGFVKDGGHLKEIIRTLYDHGVKFCLNTDNPAMLRTTLAEEFSLMREFEILSDRELEHVRQWGFDAAFTPTAPGKNLYL